MRSRDRLDCVKSFSRELHDDVGAPLRSKKSSSLQLSFLEPRGLNSSAGKARPVDLGVEQAEVRGREICLQAGINKSLKNSQ